MAQGPPILQGIPEVRYHDNLSSSSVSPDATSTLTPRSSFPPVAKGI
jgi:hypothetical protein